MTPVSPHDQGLLLRVKSVEELRSYTAGWRIDGKTIALVPTMGALHAGHTSLVDLARERADRVIVSIYVNPTQFAPNEDFDSYPRNLEEDLEKLQLAGADLVYLPTSEIMYPKGFSTTVSLPDMANCLCGVSRPHFFDGVATIVAKLLIQSLPDYAIFGEKDYQQLLIIKRMTADLDLPVEIIGAPILRKADGLAMSSRNAYLTPQERQTAASLNKILTKLAKRIGDGENPREVETDGRTALMKAGFESIDYIEARTADDLSLLSAQSCSRPARIFAAASLGGTRLIDNMAIPSLTD